jgi:DNA-binding transcriptional MerR regulator
MIRFPFGTIARTFPMNANALLKTPAFETETPVAEPLTIGEVSRLYGVTLRALRFYEQRGLLKPIRRGGARLYDGLQKVRLQMILKGKHLGFTLTEIADLLEAESSRDKKSEDFVLDEKMVLSQLRHLEERRSELDEAIEELRAAHRKLVVAAR